MNHRDSSIPLFFADFLTVLLRFLIFPVAKMHTTVFERLGYDNHRLKSSKISIFRRMNPMFYVLQFSWLLK